MNIWIYKYSPFALPSPSLFLLFDPISALLQRFSFQISESLSLVGVHDMTCICLTTSSSQPLQKDEKKINFGNSKQIHAFLVPLPYFSKLRVGCTSCRHNFWCFTHWFPTGSSIWAQSKIPLQSTVPYTQCPIPNAVHVMLLFAA